MSLDAWGDTDRPFADELTLDGEGMPMNPADQEFTLRPEVAAFARAMERRLRANDHKPGWKGETRGALLRGLHEEIRELADALWRAPHPESTLEYDYRMTTPLDNEDHARILAEAADVANFALMIADVCCGLPAPDAQEATP